MEDVINKPLQLTLVITGLNIGGAEMMLLMMLRHLDRKRFAPSVISLGGIGKIGQRIAEAGVPVTALNLRPGLPALLGIVRLASLLRRNRPDLVHTWMYHADLVGGVAAHLAGIRALAWGIRHTDLSVSANKWTTLAVVKACALLSPWLPDRVTVNSEAARKAHVSAGYVANKMVVIPNGFDLSRFVRNASARGVLREILGVDATALLVGMIGRYHAQKNHLGFVSAMAAVHALRPKVHFVLVGAGVDDRNAQLVKAIRVAGLESVVHLLGPRDDIPQLMAGLDVLALPSVGEAFPNVVGEAMACEVPCAVCNVGDSAWIVGDCGRVVAADDMYDLARAIIGLLDLPANERAALGIRARERVALLFEIGAVARQYENFYEAVAAKRCRDNAC